MNDNGYVVSDIDYKYGKIEMVKSSSMNKEFPCLIFLPDNYNKEKDFKVVYLLHGVNKQPITEDGVRALYNSKLELYELVNNFQVILVAPIVGNSYYIDSKLTKNANFATFVGEELPVFIDKNYKTLANRENRILCGFSMGGYGAVSLLCRYPETFSKALSRGGALDPAYAIKDLNWDDTGVLENILGKYWDNMEEYHLNSCLNLINSLNSRDDIGIVLEIGKEDFLWKTNQRFKKRLDELNIPHIYAEYLGGHQFSKESLCTMLTNSKCLK